MKVPHPASEGAKMSVNVALKYAMETNADPLVARAGFYACERMIALEMDVSGSDSQKAEWAEIKDDIDAWIDRWRISGPTKSAP